MTREEVAVRLLTGQKLIPLDVNTLDEHDRNVLESSERLMVEAAFRLADTFLKISKEGL